METHILALPAGYRIESYEIQAVLGKGGFGITYVALDLQLGKRVAIKELLPDTIATRVEGSTVVPQSSSLQNDWDWARESFQKEAKVLARFSHPAIVGVHRIIEANGTAYMVMDYVEGETYEARLRRIGREPDQASLMAVIGPLLDGLSDVHATGLLHRDIKPENILINRRGQPVLIDFGTARSAVGATMTMTMLGTPGYMPIEQSQTKGKKGPWTDIYAIGVMMCRAITGEKPPSATDRIMEDEFQWLSYRQIPGYSEQFLQAVDWALRVRPEERPQSIADWMPHLLSAGSATSSPPHTPVEESISETFAPEEYPPEIHSKQVHSPIIDPEPTRPKRKYQSAMLAGVVVFVSACILTPVVVNNIQRSDSEKPQAQFERIKTAQEQQRLSDAKEAVARRNAMNCATISSAACTAGATNLGSDVASVVAALEAGVTTTNGSNVFGPFSVSGLPSIVGVPANENYQTYLTATNGGVSYNPVGRTVQEQQREAREAAKKAEQARLAKEAEAAKADAAKADIAKKATKEVPFENSLGMKFVPAPGTDVLFSIWDTRVRDYAAFALATSYNAGTEWKNPSFTQTYNHPVVNVSWDDAKAFCQWLTGKERGEGRIGNEQEYRLPTDAEWSVAVGSGKYPWGNEWPPPKGMGNYDPSLAVDSYVSTSPVGSFPPNRFGLYDMGGNVWQWCDDWYRASLNESAVQKYAFLKDDGGGQKYRVVRGGSFYNVDPEFLLSSFRDFSAPDARLNYGFRCVLGASR